MQNQIQEVLNFWFVETKFEQWFIKDENFDKILKERFGALVDQALKGELDEWSENEQGLLALILLHDQMTRNIYRDTPQAFAGDQQALALSLKGQERGYLDSFDDPNQRLFLLMPMMHAEDLAIQEASLPLFEKYTNPNSYEYAIKHRDIVARFGHFPHRSPILGRPMTKEEEDFLKEPGSSF